MGVRAGGEEVMAEGLEARRAHPAVAAMGWGEESVAVAVDWKWVGVEEVAVERVARGP